MAADLAPVLPGVVYDRGYSHQTETAFLDLISSPQEKANWSDRMGDYLAESSKHHFIDRYNRALAMRALAPACVNPGAAYMDVGCAAGYLLSDVQKQFPAAQIFGSDFMVSSLKRCHENVPQIPLLRLDITNIGLPENTFDAVSCLNVLEHIQDDVKALAELKRIVKPGGRVFVTVPAAPHLYDFNDEAHFHVRRYTHHELREKIEKAGFTLVDLNYFGVFPYPAFYVRKRLNQLMFSKLSFQEKYTRAERQAHESGRLRFMEWICKIEASLGSLIRFPFGIRLYATVTKGRF